GRLLAVPCAARNVADPEPRRARRPALLHLPVHSRTGRRRLEPRRADLAQTREPLKRSRALLLRLPAPRLGPDLVELPPMLFDLLPPVASERDPGPRRLAHEILFDRKQP